MGPRVSPDYSEKCRPHRYFILISVLHLYYLFALCSYSATHTTQTPMLVAGFKPATPASDRPQTLALDRSATGIGFSPRTVKPVASCYTDCAIPAHSQCQNRPIK